MNERVELVRLNYVLEAIDCLQDQLEGRENAVDILAEAAEDIRALPRTSPSDGEVEKLREALEEICERAQSKTNAGTNLRTIWWVRARARRALSNTQSEDS